MSRPAPHPSPALSLRLQAVRLREGGRPAEAIAVLQRAPPDDPEAQAELGLNYSLLGRWAEAEPFYRRAVELGSADLFVLSNLAGTLKQLGREAEAEPLFRQILAVDPDHVAALRNLAVLLKDAGRFAESRRLSARAAVLAPSLETMIQGALSVTPMTRSEADIDAQRAAYADGLATLEAGEAAYPYLGDGLNLPWYQLPYHGRQDRDLLARTAAVLKRRTRGLADADLSGWRDPLAAGRRIRVAFCSEFLREHTIGRLFGGHLRHLDRSRFEVIVLHSPRGLADAGRAALDAVADQAVVLPADPAQQRAAIRAAAPDVLFYPDVGMSAATWFLAQSRLAPVQATSWGHPVTTGLAEMDYFLSADAIEPPEAEDNYVERLVRLRRLPACYPAPGPAPVAEREVLTLPTKGTLYGCPQTLFKFHPEFDDALAAILDGDPDGRLVLIEPRSAGWKAVLQDRWADRPQLRERTVFIRRLNQPGFMALLRHIDVLLDPFHFGSGNTLYEGLAEGTPIVTRPGAFMRSRIVAGAYRQMDIADAPVADSTEAYVQLAIGLGRDAGRRDLLKAELRAKAREALFDDLSAVRDFEAFVTAAVAAAASGERLASGWSTAENQAGS